MSIMQALIRQLDCGEKQRITLDSLQEMVDKTCSIPARVSTHVDPIIPVVLIDLLFISV